MPICICISQLMSLGSNAWKIKRRINPFPSFFFIDFRNIAKLSNTTYYSNKVFIKILQS